MPLLRRGKAVSKKSLSENSTLLIPLKGIKKMAKRNGLEIVIEENGNFTITGKIPKNPTLSKSGKSYLLASTGGNWDVGDEYKNGAIKLGLNLYAEVNENADVDEDEEEDGDIEGTEEVATLPAKPKAPTSPAPKKK
jgi:hypothetical protein